MTSCEDKQDYGIDGNAARVDSCYHDDENEYQSVLSSRRRILRDIERRGNRLKSLKKPVSQSENVSIIKFDLYETFKANQSFMDRLGDKVAGWGLDSLWEKHMNPDHRFSFTKLHQMSGFAKEWIRTNSLFDKTSRFTEKLQGQLTKFAGKHDLLEKESSSGADEPGSYQQLLDEHILDSIERAVISCEIQNRYELRKGAKDDL